MAVRHELVVELRRKTSHGRGGTGLLQRGGREAFGYASHLHPGVAGAFLLAGTALLLGWLALIALGGVAVLWRVGAWAEGRRKAGALRSAAAPNLARGRVLGAIGVLALLSMTKAFYMASLTSYYTFFLIEKFGISTQMSQVMLFLFLGGMAAGVMLGGIIGDRVGALTVIWVSILGALPLAGLAVGGLVLAQVSTQLTFLSYGTTARSARRFGSGDRAGAVVEGVQASWIAVAVGVLIVAVAYPCAPVVMRLLVGTSSPDAGVVAADAAEVKLAGGRHRRRDRPASCVHARAPFAPSALAAAVTSAATATPTRTRSTTGSMKTLRTG
mgnify:CR=1 FL=1